MRWVTGARPGIDGIACTWLIRQFVDPVAEIQYVPADQALAVAEREGAQTFDVPGGEFGHRGDRCTFEVLIDWFNLDHDPALVRLARIIHAADIAGALGTDPLAPGLAAIGEGGVDVEADDEWLVERGMFVYDALYAWCRRQTGQTEPERPQT